MHSINCFSISHSDIVRRPSKTRATYFETLLHCASCFNLPPASSPLRLCLDNSTSLEDNHVATEYSTIKNFATSDRKSSCFTCGIGCSKSLSPRIECKQFAFQSVAGLRRPKPLQNGLQECRHRIGLSSVAITGYIQCSGWREAITGLGGRSLQ